MAAYDAIIIGTGQAGPPLARRMAGSGMHVAIIERGRFGGTCVNTGCTPTKTLVASAYAAHMARRGADFGFSAGDVKVDMKRVKARKDDVVGLSNRGVERSLKSLENCQVYEAHARFVSPHEVQVGTEILTCRPDFHQCRWPRGGAANSGPRSGRLSQQQFDDGRRLPAAPPAGAGRQLYRPGIRSDVSAASAARSDCRARAAPDAREDEDVSAAIAGFLTREGISVRAEREMPRRRKQGGDIVMTVDCGGHFGDRGSHLLVATGRRPNTDDLGLDRAGVKRDERGYIIVDDELRTNVPGIWALGDCNGKGAFTHTSGTITRSSPPICSMARAGG